MNGRSDGDASPEELQRFYAAYLGMKNDDLLELKAYEDAGLTPERVAALAAAERDGRMVVLPCKVGEPIYCLNNEHLLVSRIIVEARVFRDKVYMVDSLNRAFGLEDIGESVFLTRAEAEAALAAQKEGNAQ